MKHNGLNGHFTFEPVNDSWGVRSVENTTSGAILSFDAICVGSPVNNLTKSKQGKLN